MSSKPKKLPKDEKSVFNDHIKTTLTTTPASSMIKKDQSSESIAFSKGFTSSIDTNTPSVNRTPSTGVTPQTMSTTNSISPMSVHSKEKFTPIGTKYQSKIKQVDRVVSFLRI
jgi:hypothetical protein